VFAISKLKDMVLIPLMAKKERKHLLVSKKGKEG
jgi:hypothetical protein